MTHQNHQTNGASLEDCHTNFFALADLCGIKWKKLVLNERPLATGDPLDDPVLRSYTKCLAKDILCVWRRVSQHKNELDQTGGMGMFDMSQIGVTSVIHPPLSLTAAKELWIFWYGEEPDLTDLVTPELLKAPDSGEQGSWESGLSYECRSLLFKALHNLIERCLLSRDILRLGKWFVQPSLEKDALKSSAHLSFSFAFFVHGESTVCASMDIREHPPVRPLSEQHLNEVIRQAQQNLENEEEEKENFNDINHNVSMQSVILAPFGLSAVLTGNKSENYEQFSEKIISDWNNFYPMKSTEFENSSASMPPLVEVISGGIKMLYPSKYVLVTEADARRKENCNSENKKSVNSESRAYRFSEIDKECISSGILNFCDGIQKTASGVLPERIWQDSIMNPAYTNAAVKSEQGKIEAQSEFNIENSINAANVESSSKLETSTATWNFAEPNHKANCLCARCKNLENHGSFSSLKAPGSSSSLSGKSNFRNNSNRNRTPFHKRSDSSLSKSKDRYSNQPTATSKFNNRSAGKSGTQSCNTNEGPQMSIGSVGSIMSPLHQNLSVHSQPSSVPINEQSILSPTPRSDVSPPSPSHENNKDQKSETQNSKAAEKALQESAQPNKMTPEDFINASKSDFRANNQEKQSESQTRDNKSLKRPALLTQDCENFQEDDFSTNQILYDYSTWDAWMNHPIKRFKSGDLERYRTNKNSKYDLYAGQMNEQAILQHNANQLLGDDIKRERYDESRTNANGGKENRSDSEADKNSNSENLFTSEGLQPSYADLNKIFDNSDDNSNDDHIVDNTPPGSNKSIGCHPDMELSENETKRDKMTFGNFANLHNNGLTSLINSNNLNTLGLIRNEDLTKMFPTPPSIEQHTNSSPGGICCNISDGLMESSEMHSSGKADPYHNFGSPPEEPIEDWSYVFIPTKMSSIVGSSKYAPLSNLLSQTLPALNLPPICAYKPSWIKQKEQEEIRKRQIETSTVKIDTTKKEVKEAPMETLREVKIEPGTSMIHKHLPSTPNFGARPIKTEGGSTIINKLLSQPSPSPNFYKTPIHQSIESPSAGNMQNNYNSPYGGVLGQDPMSRKFMGMPIHPPHHSQPPPPYDMAIHSPSLNMNLHPANLDDMGNNSKKKIATFARPMKNGQKIPEANSLLVNVLLYDTSLNIFRDHNFDSCTICVCNAGPKCVGNIRGLDSGIYLSLTASCHFNENLNGIVESSHEGKSSASIRDQSKIKYMGNNRNLMNHHSTESPASISSMSSCSSSGSSSSSSSGSSCSSLETMSPCTSNVQLMLAGYPDDDPISCRCGFSAVANRRLAHQTGLFYEDEMEITGVATDPSGFKKRSLLSLLLKQRQNKFNQGEEDKQKAIENVTKEIQEISLTNLSPIFDLLREQCTLFQNSSNSVQRAIKHLNQEKYSPIKANNHVNILEFIDAFDIISLALEHGRYIFERFDGYNNRQLYIPNQQAQDDKKSSASLAISVHKWPFLNAAGPKSNQDIIRVMKSMQALLQKAFNQNGTTGLWDAPYAVKGPLTWREFHRLAGRGIGQCEPQPVPSVVVGHDKEWLCVSPYALQFWDKLLLEPYSHPRDIAYIVVTPDNNFITSKVKAFFKELSTTYEMCRLGRHQPIKGWEGILRVGKSPVKCETNSLDDEWLKTVDTNKLNELLRLYGIVLQQQLVPYLSKVPHDRSLLYPADAYSGTTFRDHQPMQRTSLASPMLPPHTPDGSSMSGNGNMSMSNDKGPNTPKSDQDDSKDITNPITSAAELMNFQCDQHSNPPHIVLYIVEPFTSGTDSTSLERFACLSLLKYYSNVLNEVPESIRQNISVQIVSQESILELGRNRDITRWSDHMRNLALNVFTQSHRYLSHAHSVKSLTGFGTAANAETFMKTKDEKNRASVKLYTPPYILSTRNAKSENVENFGQGGMEQQCSSIMYCCYCLSEDQSMLLAVVTDERGEFLENCTINIDIPNRKRRKKASARRIGLQKLMDFILGVMSQTVKPWRLVIGRIGRIGHGELKGWSWLLSKPNLLKASKYLKDICKQCSVMYPQAVPSIWSACLVTLEPDSNFRVMPDQFTPDERFSQRSTQSPLSTPQDVTCTHILVFPTSAILQSSQATFHEQHLENALDFGEDFIIDENDDVDDDINGIQHLFDEWNDGAVGIPQTSPTRDDHRGSPLTMDEHKSRQSPGMTDNQMGQSRNMFSVQEAEEVGQLLQQPLALGYLVSTAPTGRMPSWFWSCCPHLENVCPVFLKTALHIHSPSIHKENDDIYYKEQSSKIEHPLDSNTTADVLRYVLEGYNVLSWLAMDSNTHDRLSCLPIHVQMLMQLYHLHTALA